MVPLEFPGFGVTQLGATADHLGLGLDLRGESRLAALLWCQPGHQARRIWGHQGNQQKPMENGDFTNKNPWKIEI